MKKVILECFSFCTLFMSEISRYCFAGGVCLKTCLALVVRWEEIFWVPEVSEVKILFIFCLDNIRLVADGIISWHWLA